MRQSERSACRVVLADVPVIPASLGARGEEDEIGGVKAIVPIDSAPPAPHAPRAPNAPDFPGTREFLWVSFAIHTVFLLLQFTYLWLDDVVRAEEGTFVTRLLEESTGAYGSFALSVLVLFAWRAAPLRGPAMLRRLPGYLALGLLLSALNTTFMWGSRSVLFPALGLGAYDYGRMPLRYLMEAPGSLIGFATLLAVLALFDEVRTRRERARAQAELERALVATQLQNLRLQLQPHFLFNALNTISSRLHDDPVAADGLIGQLSDLLRASLQANERQQVSLAEELGLLRAYTVLMQARFEDRLRIELQVEPGLEEVLVPPLLLQPLVENAVRHGGLEREGRSEIRVQVARDGERLRVEVRDDGPGMPAGRDALTTGTGLRTTARRLALLHGDAASLHAGNGAAGGFVVTLSLPVAR